MEAFEVYMQKEYPNIKVNSDDYIHSLHMWRAALKWILTQKIQSTEEILIDEDAIKKELEVSPSET